MDINRCAGCFRELYYKGHLNFLAYFHFQACGKINQIRIILKNFIIDIIAARADSGYLGLVYVGFVVNVDWVVYLMRDGVLL